MKMQTKNEIKQHYKKQAEKFGTGGRSTISDMNTRKLELKALLNYLGDSKKVLEVGCGNGYIATQIIRQRVVDLTAIDFSEDLIELAKRQPLERAKGKVVFGIGDATELSFLDETFDTVYTDRCLINLITWENQKKAISEIYRVLKKGGLFIMLESFTDGLKNMNEARRELGLEEIPEPDFDIYFDKEKVLEFTKDKFNFLKEDNFLSSYYFGSRVLYPALLNLTAKKEPKYDSKLNSFFAEMPAFGNHSGIKLMIFKKKKINS